MKRKSFYSGLGLLALFIIWTVALGFVDVGEIGPQGSSVGFATLNKMIHNITGVHMSGCVRRGTMTERSFSPRLREPI